MDKWIALARDMITLLIFVGGFATVVFKWMDAWEKRKTVQYKELSDRVDKVETCCRKIEDENIDIRSKAKDTWELILKWFEK